MERGKYVSRSVYQKVCEENKKLLADIKILTAEGINADAVLLKMKWQKKFKKDKQFNELLKDAANIYLDEHPKIKTMSDNLGRDLAKDKMAAKIDSNPKAFK